MRVKNNLTPLKAIRAKCLECSNNQPKEVRLCEMVNCPNYMYRFGKNPSRKGIGRLKGFSLRNNEVSNPI